MSISIRPTEHSTISRELNDLIELSYPDPHDAWQPRGWYSWWTLEDGIFKGYNSHNTKEPYLVLPVALLNHLGFEFWLELEEPETEEEREEYVNAVSLATACGWEILD